MPRDVRGALDYAREQHKEGSRQWHGICLVFVRTCFDIPAHYPSAAAAWEGAGSKHKVSKGADVPRGVPFFWTGGSQGFGHIVLSAGGGLCWSNDIKVDGGISLVRIDEITAKWGQTPQGWSEDLNTERVWKKPDPPVVDLEALMRAYRKDPEREGDKGTKGARVDVRRVERALMARGYLDRSYHDGSFGSMTVDAVRKFQNDQGIDGKGEPNLATLRALGKGRFRIAH